MPSRYDREDSGYPMETFNNGQKRSDTPVLSVDANVGAALISSPPKRNSDFRAEPHLPGTYVPYELRIRFLNTTEQNLGLSRWKRKTFNFLEGHQTFGSKLYNHAVIFIILGSIGFAVAATVKQTDIFRRRISLVTLGYEVFLFVIVLVEYVLRLWSCSANSSYIGWSGTLRFVRRPIMILDVLVMLSSFVLIVTLAMDLRHEDYRYLLLLQLLRVLRIDRHRGAFATFKCVVKNHFKELLTCWYMGFIVIMFLSYITYADPTISKKHTVSDLANGLYWGVVSMTTIGYGDVAPATGLSKLVLCIFALMGAGFIAMPAGIIGSGFALQVIEQRKLKEKTRRRRPAAELIQGAWKVYASVPSSNCTETWHPHTGITVQMTQSMAASTVSLSAPKVAEEDAWGNIDFAARELTRGEKHALGFIRRLKLNVAVRNFKQSTRPYDVKDILDRFATSHVEIFERIKEVRKRVEESMKTQGTEKKLREQTDVRLERIEEKVNNLTDQISDVTCLLRELLAERYIQSGEGGSDV